MTKLTNKQIDLIRQAIDSLESAAEEFPHAKEVEQDWRELIDIIDTLDDYITDRELSKETSC